MNLKDRFNILKQSAQIAQSKGVLSLNDAVYVKQAIDSIDANSNLDVAVKILSRALQLAQSKGVYTLKDAYIIYIALDGIEAEIEKYLTAAQTVEEAKTEKSNDENIPPTEGK